MAAILCAIFVPTLLLAVWLRKRLGRTPSWGALGLAGGAAFLPAYAPAAGLWLLSRIGHFLIWSGLDKEAHPYASRFVEAFLGAAIPEELFKFGVLLLFCGWRGKVRTIPEGILLGAAVGMGHALGENCQDILEGARVALISGVIKLIYLTALGILMGSLVSKAYSEAGRQLRLFLWALLFPVILHGLFDFGYFVGELMEFYSEKNIPAPILLCVLMMFVVWFVPIVWAWRIVRKTDRPNIATTADAPT